MMTHKRARLQKTLAAELLPVLEREAAAERTIPFSSFSLVLELERVAPQTATQSTRDAWRSAASQWAERMAEAGGFIQVYGSRGIRYYRLAPVAALRTAKATLAAAPRGKTKAELLEEIRQLRAKIGEAV